MAQTPNPTTPADEVAPGVPADRVKRLAAGKAEHAAMQAWKAKPKGKQGRKPATPVLDWMEANPVGSTKTTKSGTTRAPKVAMTFFKNGKPMNRSNNSLSSLAYQGTRGIDGDRPRIPTGDLVKLLAKLGVTEPATTSWSVELPNGVLLAARVEGDTTPVPQPQAKAPAPKPSEVKAARAAASKTAKAPAKATRKRTVNPRPKASTTKARKAS